MMKSRLEHFHHPGKSISVKRSEQYYRPQEGIKYIIDDVSLSFFLIYSVLNCIFFEIRKKR